jgi:TonB family protein
MAGPTPIRKRLVRFLALSAILHVAVATFLLIAWRRSREHAVVQPAAVKYYATSLQFAGGIKAPWTPEHPGRKKHATAVPKPPSADVARNAPPAPTKGEPPASPASAGEGKGSDQDNANPAFPVFSPRPAVSDRSLLPDGNREVVVDVKVSAQGDVLEATLVKGIGNALDQIVLETVKTWRFHPASISGTAVASEAELIFPFDQHYTTG